jgi:ethanolamine utilization protein EutN
MLRARIEGQVVATRKHRSLTGWRLLLCQPIDAKGEPEGLPQVAIDPYGAGMHSTVILSGDGVCTRRMVKDPTSPVRMMIIAVEDVEEGAR